MVGDFKHGGDAGAQVACALCERPLGQKVEMHHLIPKSMGGRAVVPLHPICHRMIHKTFRERELARSFASINALRSHPDIGQFLRWVANKPADFYRRTAERRRKHSR